MSEIKRRIQAGDLPYKPKPGTTHWEGCWREPGHHNCAVVKLWRMEGRIEELEDEVRQLRRKRDELLAEMGRGRPVKPHTPGMKID